LWVVCGRDLHASFVGGTYTSRLWEVLARVVCERYLHESFVGVLARVVCGRDVCQQLFVGQLGS
jgi:hypothetical protein